MSFYRFFCKRFLLARGWSADDRARPNVAGQVAKWRHAGRGLPPRSLRNAVDAERRAIRWGVSRFVSRPVRRILQRANLSAITGFALRMLRRKG